MSAMVDRKSPSGADLDREKFPNGAARALDARTAAQVEELQRLAMLGFRCMDAFEAMADRLDQAKDIGLFLRPRNGVISEFVRLERAVRRTIILQRELLGLRSPRVIRPPRVRRRDAEDDAEDDLRERPDTATGRDRRDDWDKLDYRPVGEAVDWIRQTLGADPPERNPFSPPDSGPAPEAKPEPEPEPPPEAPAAAAPHPKGPKPVPMGQLRAKLFRSTHFSPAAPAAPLPGIGRPGPTAYQPPRGPP
jgi:hypothetical protein